MFNIRREAYDIIVKVLKNNEYSDSLLQQHSKKMKQAESNQIALLYQLVKGSIKYKMNLEYICRQLTDKDKYEKTDIKIKALLYLGLFQLIHLKSIPDHAAINETVELAKTIFGDSIAGLVNSVLRSFQRNPDIKYPQEQPERIAFEHSYPLELVREWIKIWGVEQTEMLTLFFNETPKLHLRVNTIATSRFKLVKYFEKRNIACRIASSSSNMLVCENAVEALSDIAFSEGYYSVQDTSAAMIVELLDPRLNESVLDLFSAPGGKCTYISEIMNNTGEVIAVDRMPGKMKLLKKAAERLQLTNINLVVKDAFQFGPVAPAYDKVLVDAPCSGWGVLARKADLRWQTHQDTAELIKLQEKAINYASNFVIIGGSLVYSTCTMNPLENEKQAEAFLKKNRNFELITASSVLPQEFVTSDGYFKSIPFKHFMDGAFAAKFIRIK